MRRDATNWNGVSLWKILRCKCTGTCEFEGARHLQATELNETMVGGCLISWMHPQRNDTIKEFSVAPDQSEAAPSSGVILFMHSPFHRVLTQLQIPRYFWWVLHEILDAGWYWHLT